MEKQKKESENLNKKMTFSELLGKHPESVEVLLESGMHCIGCPMSMQETIERGAMAHGINPDELIKKIKLNKVKNGK